MGKSVKFLLLISLGLNLVLVGGIVGFYARGCSTHRRPFLPPPQLAQQLSPEKKELFEAAMKSLAVRSRGLNRTIQEKQKEIQSILTAEHFDANAFQQKSQELHQLHGQRKALLDQTIMELAGQLTRKERQLLAGLLRPPPPGHRPPRHGAPNDMPPPPFPPPGPPPGP